MSLGTGGVLPTLAQHLITPERVLLIINDRASLAAYIEETSQRFDNAQVPGNLRQLLGYDVAPRGADKKKCEGHQLLDTVHFLVPKQGSGRALPLVGTVDQNWKRYKLDCASLDPSWKPPNEMPAVFKKLVAGSKSYNGWRRAEKEEAASLQAKTRLLGHGASLVGLVFEPLPSPAPLPDYVGSMSVEPSPLLPPPSPALQPPPQQHARLPSSRARRPLAQAPLPNPQQPPALGRLPSAQAPQPNPQHEYRHGDDVLALFAHVRERGKVFQIELGVPAESIKGEGKQTHADLIIMAFAKKAGWLLERKQDEPDDEGTKAQKLASMFSFGKRSG